MKLASSPIVEQVENMQVFLPLPNIFNLMDKAIETYV